MVSKLILNLFKLRLEPIYTDSANMMKVLFYHFYSITGAILKTRLGMMLDIIKMNRVYFLEYVLEKPEQIWRCIGPFLNRQRANIVFRSRTGFIRRDWR